MMLSIDSEDRFYCQLAKSIQAWLWIETETYLLYAGFMKGANSHLVSVSFHHIQSFVSKLELLNSCLILILGKESEEWREWKRLFNCAQKLNKKRNRIVHEPVVVSGDSHGRQSIAVRPSLLNAISMSKGLTTLKGAIDPATYEPSSVKLVEDHKIGLDKLYTFEQEFKKLAHELRAFRKTAENIFEKWKP